jgi:thiol-disulfide isomerase/thioredoxin
MKTHFFKALCAAVSVCAAVSCGSQKQDIFRINGTVSDEISDTAYYVYIGDTAFNIDVKVAPVDTIIVKDKKFSYTSDVKEPRLIFLQAVFKSGEVSGAYVDFVLVPGETANLKVCNGYFELDSEKPGFYKQWHDFDLLCTPLTKMLNEEYTALGSNPGATDEQREAFYKKVEDTKKTLLDYVNAHNNEEGTLLLASKIGFTTPHNLFDNASEEVKNGQFKSFIDREIKAEDARAELEKQTAETLAKTSEGAMFVDFSAEYDGKTQKLSDFVGKGKYVLVDFWASWCGPCKREIPNLISVYNKYKGSKFEVIGVATWDEPDDTKAAIAELQIPYPQIMNAQEAGSNAYGIQGIPEIILFGPDGKILKRGLRGEEIELAVKEYVK